MAVLGGRNNRFVIVVGALLIAIYYYSTRLSGGGFSLWPSRSHIKWNELKLRHRPKFVTPLPIGRIEALPPVQYDFKPESGDEESLRKQRQFAVKNAFVRSWDAYKKYAWRADELQPVSGTAKNNFAGWGASLVDNLDTLWLMDMKDEFDAAVTAAMDIRFDKSTLHQVNVFETTIRYLGGFLSAYDLSNDWRLLDKAAELGDMLLHAFDTPNHLPITRWHFQDAIRKKPQQADETVLIAELGSLSMEFTRLSQRTGDARYYSRIANITLNLAAQQNHTKLPGMWPVVVNARDVNFTQGNSFTLGGMADSVYEYLPKMHALLGGRVEMYADMYRTFSATAMAHNIRRPMTPDDADILLAIDIIVTETGNYLHEQGQHLSCFAGGMFALAGKLLSLPAHVDVGRRLTDGCVWAYGATPTGIMPEIFTMGTCTTHLNGGATDAELRRAERDCAWNETRYNEDVLRQAVANGNPDADSGPTAAAAQKVIREERLPRGFTTVKDRRYLLRPEAIESVFVLYRVTGDKTYLERAWNMFETVVKLSETKYANGMITDVTVPKDEVQIGDTMESFWMAETLKYYYLIFSDTSLISLDEWVFNTEAHPFKRPTGMDMMDHKHPSEHVSS